MRKVINPCKCETYRGKSNAFVEIEYDEKKGNLSLHGVVGPMSNGNCTGSAGQCVDEIRHGYPTKEWTPGMLKKLCNIWDRWHLNDMRPYCQHQKELGWRDLAGEEIKLYHYILNKDSFEKQEAAKKAAIAALKNGEPFTPTQEQTFYTCLDRWLDTYEPIGELAAYYEPHATSFHGATETKLRGWVRIDESEQGILCKPCPVCGYKYGTKWLKEEVPQDVIDWLFELPDTAITPAWV